MGWSCGAKAAETMDKIQKVCFQQTKSGNVYLAKTGKAYFFEPSGFEHTDGAITGRVYRIIGDYSSDRFSTKEAGSFRINGNGTISRFPHFQKELIYKERA